MRSIIKAAVRVIIIIIFVSLLKHVISTLQWLITIPNNYMIPQDLPYLIGIVGGPFIIFTLILYFLWRNTDWIVRVIAGNLNDNELVIKTSNLDLVKVFMRIFGIFLIVTSIPELFGLAVYHIVLIIPDELMYSPISRATTLMNIVTIVLTMGVGTWLVIGTRGITKVIDNVMNAPISEVEE